MTTKRIEDNVLIETVYHRRFQWNDPKRGTGGFGFDCDEHGNVDINELMDVAKENYRKCLAGEYDVKDCGVVKSEYRNRLCNCGSELVPETIYDARGIYVTKCCEKCKAERLKGYRKDIFTDSEYECDEPIDAEE